MILRASRLGPLALLTILGGCSCDGNSLGALAPKIRVTPSTVSFDTIPVGVAARAEVLVENRGDAPLRLQALELEGPGLALEDPPTLPLDLPPLGQATLVLRYAPTSLEPSNGALKVRSNDPSAPLVTVPINAARRSGPVLVVCVDSDEIPLASRCGAEPALPFGSVRPAELRDARVRLYSAGTEPLTLTAPTLQGGNTGAFTLTSSASGPLPAGGVRTLLVQFAPQAEGAYSTSLAIGSSDGPRNLAVSGAGAPGALCVHPAVVDFGSAASGAQVERTLTVEDCGQAPVTVRSVQIISGGEALSFVNAVATPVTLQPTGGLVLPVNLRWSPTSADLVARLRVDSDQGSAVVTLQGRLSRGCQLSAAPPYVAIDLEQARDGVTEVLNVGTEPCFVVRSELSRGSEVFKLDGGPVPYTIAPGNSRLLSIAVEPGQPPPLSGEITVATNDQQLLIPVRAGLGPQEPCVLTVVPDILSFGDVSPSSERVLAVLAVSHGGGRCFIHEATLSGDSAFHLDPLTTSTVGALGLPLNLHFGPTAASGAAHAVLHLRTNDEDSPNIEVQLSGYAGAPGLCVEPRAIDFGQVSGEATASFQVIACGARPVQVTALDFVQADVELTLVGAPALPLALSAGDARTIQLRYRPVDEVPDTAVLAVRSDDPSRPSVEVRVTGGASIVPPEAVHFLYLWHISGTGSDERPAEGATSDILRMPLQGARQLEPFWGPLNAKPCTGCHSLSPDGRFAAVVQSDGINPSRGYVVDTLTKQYLPLPSQHESGLYFSWNPVTATQPPYQYVFAQDGNLHLASLYTGYLGPLAGADTRDFNETMPSWGPDGRIYFSRFPGAEDTKFGGVGVGQLMVVPAAGGTATAIYPSTDGISRYYPSISRDGRWLAHTTSRAAATTISAQDARIELVAADGSGGLRTLDVLNVGASSYSTWSRDGRWLSFASNRPGGQGSFDLYYAAFSTQTGTVGAAVAVPGVNTPEFEHAAQWGP